MGMRHPNFRIVLTSKKQKRDTLAVFQSFISFKREKSKNYKTNIPTCLYSVVGT